MRLLSMSLRRLLPTTLICVAVLASASCTRNQEKLLFDGNFYKAKTKSASKDDRKIFETVVRRPDQGIKGALAAGEHDAKGYCLKNFGTSEIAWTRGPTDPQAALYAQSGSLVLNGSCVLW
ncbi:MAG: hypothetical protein AAF231_04805 [Pseudomonadota bacterium]